MKKNWGVVQLVGHLTVNEDGEGSNPSAPANLPCANEGLGAGSFLVMGMRADGSPHNSLNDVDRPNIQLFQSWLNLCTVSYSDHDCRVGMQIFVCYRQGFCCGHLVNQRW